TPTAWATSSTRRGRGRRATSGRSTSSFPTPGTPATRTTRPPSPPRCSPSSTGCTPPPGSPPDRGGPACSQQQAGLGGDVVVGVRARVPVGRAVLRRVVVRRPVGVELLR